MKALGDLLTTADFPVAQTAEHLSIMRETQVQALVKITQLKEMATHSEILLKILWTLLPEGLQPRGS